MRSRLDKVVTLRAEDIDLHDVRRDLQRVPEAGVARTGVVDRDPDAELARWREPSSDLGQRDSADGVAFAAGEVGLRPQPQRIRMRSCSRLILS